MSAIRPYYEHGPETHVVSAAVTGGQLVEPDTGNAGMVKACAAGSKKCLGVAETDAQPATNTFGSGTTGYLAPFVDVSIAPPQVAVGTSGVYLLTYAAPANFGDLLITAANGQVTPYTTGSTAYDLIVGRCVEPGGVAAAGAQGKTRLMLA